MWRAERSVGHHDTPNGKIPKSSTNHSPLVCRCSSEHDRGSGSSKISGLGPTVGPDLDLTFDSSKGHMQQGEERGCLEKTCANFVPGANEERGR